MHLILLVAALGLALGVRFLGVVRGAPSQAPSCCGRWFWALGRFLFPPLLLLMTALAIVWMHPLATAADTWDNRVSYGFSLGFLAAAGGLMGYQVCRAFKTQGQVRAFPQQGFAGQRGRLLDSPVPFIAQVGVWQPELVVSQGLLDTLSPGHLQAVLVHEQAHGYYRDTFWFFWLGWLKQLTCWLPQTENLWQELLLLRELRADRWAACRVDSLLLAEALYLLVSQVGNLSETFAAGLYNPAFPDRLSQRIESLLAEPEPWPPSNFWVWVWVALSGLPLATIPFHSLSHQHYCLML